MTKPAVVCGSETWAVAEMDMKRGEGKILQGYMDWWCSKQYGE